MSARAPSAIYTLWYAVLKAIPRAQLGGIVGDTLHSFGYHLARRDLPGSDYSMQLRPDKLGASDCASALDVSLPPDLMKTCTARLLAAARAGDPRLRALREFCGTLDGQHTYPWDMSSNTSEGIDTWDSSHLWHIHLSFYREFADDPAALAPIADVLAGVSTDWFDMATEAELRTIVHEEVGKYMAIYDPKTKTWDGGGHAIQTVIGHMIEHYGLDRVAAEVDAVKTKAGA